VIRAVFVMRPKVSGDVLGLEPRECMREVKPHVWIRIVKMPHACLWSGYNILYWS
jgi:hypothetical protein